MTQASSELSFWKLRIQEFDFSVQHQARIFHMASDALYPLPTTCHDSTPLQDDIPILQVILLSSENEQYDNPCNDKVDIHTPEPDPAQTSSDDQPIGWDTFKTEPSKDDLWKPLSKNVCCKPFAFTQNA